MALNAGVFPVAGAGGIRLALEPLAPPKFGAEAPAVLFLPGGGQTRHSWRATGMALGARGHACWLADLRGHGDSDWAADGDYSLDAFRDDVSAHLAAVGRPAVVVGASQGGVSGLLAAGETRNPAIRGLVMVDIAGKVGSNTDIFDFMRAAEKGFADAAEAAALVSAFLPDRTQTSDPARLARNLRRRPDGRFGWHWDPRYVGVDALEQAKARQGRLEAAALHVDVPVLIARGEHSEVLSLADAQDFARILPHGDVVEIAGAGHMIVGDQNGAFSGAIAAFLSGIDFG